MYRSSLVVVGSALLPLLVVACGHEDTAAGDTSDLTAASHAVKNFECTAVASSTSDEHLKKTRLDVTVDVTPAGKPSGNLATAFEASLSASSAIGFGVSHVRETTASGHQVSEYKIGAGADSILHGASGGTLTLPTAFTHLALEDSAALNVATLVLTPSNTTVTYKCKQDTRKADSGPAPDPLVFEGAAKDVVARDSCAKSVASAVMTELIDEISDHGLDLPDTFVFTKIDRTDVGFKAEVNGRPVPVVVGPGCNIKSIDTAAAVPFTE
jgi:hypothetical protein